MKAKTMVVAVVLFTGWSAVTAQADFKLTGTEHLDITESHALGVLYDSSTADVIGDGYVDWVYVNDSALLNVQPPSGDAIHTAMTYGSGRIEISSGNVYRVYSYEGSEANVTGGSITGFMYAHDNSTISVGGGSNADTLSACESSTVTVSGGNVSKVRTYDSSKATIDGGSVPAVEAQDTSYVLVSGGEVGSLHAFDMRPLGPARVKVTAGTVDELSLDFVVQDDESFSFTGQLADLVPHGVVVSEGTVGSFRISTLESRLDDLARCWRRRRRPLGVSMVAGSG